MRRVRNSFGFSLVELMTALALFSIVMIMVSTLFMHSIRSYISSDALCQSVNDARYAMQYIAEEVRKSGFMPNSIDAADSGILNIRNMEDTGNTTRILCGTAGENKALKRLTVRNGFVINTVTIIDNAESIIFTYDSMDNALNITLTTSRHGARYTLHTKIYSRIGL